VTHDPEDTISEGDRILGNILAQADNSDSQAQALLRLCFRGYPLDKLRALTQSANTDLVKIGVYYSSPKSVCSAKNF
jgi:hypothetical protein